MSADSWGERMPRTLGVFSTIAVSVGISIGSGIFRVPAVVAAVLPDAGSVLICWVAAVHGGGVYSHRWAAARTVRRT